MHSPAFQALQRSAAVLNALHAAAVDAAFAEPLEVWTCMEHLHLSSSLSEGRHRAAAAGERAAPVPGFRGPSGRACKWRRWCARA